jgi:hypothetical protein
LRSCGADDEEDKEGKEEKEEVKGRKGLRERTEQREMSTNGIGARKIFFSLAHFACEQNRRYGRTSTGKKASDKNERERAWNSRQTQREIRGKNVRKEF